MKILFFRGPESDQDPLPLESSDETTLEFETGGVCHVEEDDPHNYTLYTNDGQWYITLTDHEIEMIHAAYVHGEYPVD